MQARPGRVLILGAHSDIAVPLARLYAEDGYDVILAARSPERLEGNVADLRIRYGHSVEAWGFDVLDTEGHRSFVERLGELPDSVISLIGLMTSNTAAQRDFEAASLMIRSNYLGLVSILGELANRMEQRGSGTIIGVSSVAGDRGRASNYVYGSAKAGFTAFMSGLRNRLFTKGVTVITIKPGYVRTRMTEGMDLPSILTADAEEVARAIRAAHKRKRLIVYHRPIWRWIMFVICAVPENLFQRTKF
jgi:short-subunit dehydrogenase